MIKFILFIAFIALSAIVIASKDKACYKLMMTSDLIMLFDMIFIHHFVINIAFDVILIVLATALFIKTFKLQDIIKL